MAEWLPGYNLTTPNAWSMGYSPVNNFGGVSNNPLDTGMAPSGAAIAEPGGFLSSLQSQGLGFNIPTLQLGFGALQGLGNLWGGIQTNRLARDNFRLTKDVTNTNLNNSIQSYNTALDDRIRARAAVNGMSAGEVDAYLAKNRLTRG